MKKTALTIFLVLLLAGAAIGGAYLLFWSIPDPEAAIQAELAAAKDPENPLIQEQLEQSFNLTGKLDADPALRTAANDALSAILERTEFDIIDTQFDKRAGTAAVTILVTVYDRQTALDIYSELAYERLLTFYADAESTLSEAEVLTEMMRVYAEIVRSDSVGTVEKTVILNMRYDREARQWVADNPAVLSTIFE